VMVEEECLGERAASSSSSRWLRPSPPLAPPLLAAGRRDRLRSWRLAARLALERRRAERAERHLREALGRLALLEQQQQQQRQQRLDGSSSALLSAPGDEAASEEEEESTDSDAESQADTARPASAAVQRRRLRGGGEEEEEEEAQQQQHPRLLGQEADLARSLLLLHAGAKAKREEEEDQQQEQLRSSSGYQEASPARRGGGEGGLLADSSSYSPSSPSRRLASILSAWQHRPERGSCPAVRTPDHDGTAGSPAGAASNDHSLHDTRPVAVAAAAALSPSSAASFLWTGALLQKPRPSTGRPASTSSPVMPTSVDSALGPALRPAGKALAPVSTRPSVAADCDTNTRTSGELPPSNWRSWRRA